MISVAFWNTGKQSGLEPHIAGLALDVLKRANGSPVALGLTEAASTHVPTVKSLLPGWTIQTSIFPKFILIQSPGFALSVHRQTASGVACSFTPAGGLPTEWLLWFVHLPAPVNENPEISSTLNGSEFRRNVESLEGERATTRTLAIGDFNMDPYSAGMTATRALNAVMCRSIASRPPKGADGTTNPFFYNPMWNGLGDQTATQQPGSYFRPYAKTNSAFWHAWDQALIRPSITEKHEVTANFVTQIQGKSLLAADGRLSNLYSDHLPLELRIVEKTP